MGATTTAAVTAALRRIDKLEAERRRISRALRRCSPGSDLARDTARQRDAVDEQLECWRAFVSHAEAAGFKVWSREDFARGDFVRFRDVWYEVLRVNRRSVTVPRPNGSGGDVVCQDSGGSDGTWTIGYHDGITGRMSAGELNSQRPKDPEG